MQQLGGETYDEMFKHQSSSRHELRKFFPFHDEESIASLASKWDLLGVGGHLGMSPLRSCQNESLGDSPFKSQQRSTSGGRGQAVQSQPKSLQDERRMASVQWQRAGFTAVTSNHQRKRFLELALLPPTMFLIVGILVVWWDRFFFCTPAVLFALEDLATLYYPV